MNFDDDLDRESRKMSMPSTFSRAAQIYAQRGWQVLPLWWPGPAGECACGRPGCDSVGKHPVHRLVPRGLLDASSHLGTIATWWRSMPLANVGIRTGAESALVVLDVDGAIGRQALRDLVDDHSLFEASWARTGGGGWHAYFAHPGGAVPTSAGRIGARLDMRGDGGYVVAPPSRHWSGRCYRWIVPPDGCRHVPAGALPPLPPWLLDLTLPSPARGSEPAHICLRTHDIAAYAAAALEREAHHVEHAVPGERNDTLNRAAFRLGQLIGAGLLDEATTTAALVDAGLAAGPSERKIRATVERAILAGKRHPRNVLHHPCC